MDHCFDIFVSKLCETIFTYYKSSAARYALFPGAYSPLPLMWKHRPLYFCWLWCSELLDPSFVFALDNGEKCSVQPMRFTALLKMTRVKVNCQICLTSPLSWNYSGFIWVFCMWLDKFHLFNCQSFILSVSPTAYPLWENLLWATKVMW